MARRTSSFEFAAVSTSPSRGRQKALYEALRDAITAGQLKPGARVPSSRDLAEQYGVARATAVSVYDQLRAEGYLIGRSGSGTYVSELAPEKFLRRSRLAKASLPARQQRPRPGFVPRARPLTTLSFPTAATPSGVVPFLAHLPALDEFPRELWARTVAKAARRLPASALADGEALGLLPLRESIAHYLNSARGVRCDADQILVVSGTQQSLDLCARLLLSEGDSAVVEDPGYIGARRVLAAAGGNVVPVPVDDEGIVLTQACRLAPTARLIHVTPAHQAPTGAVLPLQRRRALLAWAGTVGAWVFEDDYDSEYRYSGRPIPALHGLDSEDGVLHAGSFSKTMFPALRLGYLVVPSSLSQGFAAARSNLDRYPSILHQAAMATFIADGHYARHLRRMRLIYAQRHAALEDAVHRHARSLLELAPHPAGLETVAWLPDGVDDTDVVRRLAAVGLHLEPVSKYRLKAHGRPGLVLGFAAFAPELIDKSIMTLARALPTAVRESLRRQISERSGCAT